MRNTIRVLACLLLSLLSIGQAAAQTANALGVFDQNQYTQFLNNENCLTITAATKASAAVITTNLPHNMNPAWAGSEGNTITIAGATGMTGINGTWSPTWLSPTTFSIPYNSTSAPTYTGGGYFPNGLTTSTGQPLPSTWNPTSCPLSTLWDYINNVPFGTTADPIYTSPKALALSHASTTALGTSLVVKASAGNLAGFNCTGITGGAAGYCIVYNGTSAPGTGALTGANVLDFCYFDSTPRGCSLSRIPDTIAYSTGMVVLISSAASPYTYTTGTDTGAIEADYQ